MDAAELARWTRFAAKGGIGKCMAIQDCIAESPEDLMFLKVCFRSDLWTSVMILMGLVDGTKDDEITVLMQLNGQPGRYLVYLYISHLLHGKLITMICTGILRGRRRPVPGRARSFPCETEAASIDETSVFDCCIRNELACAFCHTFPADAACPAR